MINQAQLECHNINYKILCCVVQCEFQRRRGEDNIAMMYYRRKRSFIFWEISTASVFKIHNFLNVVTLVFLVESYRKESNIINYFTELVPNPEDRSLQP